MPSIDFVLPHGLYWLGLFLFPLLAMWLARRSVQNKTSGYQIVTAYFVWAVGGFLGLHRLYLRNLWGLLYWPLFFLILYASATERDARVAVSDTRAELSQIEDSLTRNGKRLEKAEETLEKNLQRKSELDGSNAVSVRLVEKRIKKAEKQIADAKQTISKNESLTQELTSRNETARSYRQLWSNIAWYLFLLVVTCIVLDAILLPRMLKRATPPPHQRNNADAPTDDHQFVGNGLSGFFDRLSLYSGEYVAFWSVIAVFVYYYEVLVRYVFNSPTNWAHESMFLMFGMQYLIAGSYAMLTGSHVRVDIFYAKFSTRGKAFIDLLTSIFFFIFAGTLLMTGWTFATDAMQGGDWTKWEVSFTEWAIQYWPVKMVLVIGSLLLLGQGISEVMKDFWLVVKGEKNGA